MSGNTQKAQKKGACQIFGITGERQ